MKIIDQEIIEDILKARVNELNLEKNNIIKEKKLSKRPIPDDETLYDLSVSKVSNKKHPQTRAFAKENHAIDDIIVNEGGSQTAKINDLNKKGKSFVHITLDMVSYEKDKKRGF